MWIHRRDFLKHAVATGSVMALPRLSWSMGARKEPGARTLVLLHLNGGNDGLNTVVPYRDRRYPVLRPGLALGAGQVRKIDDRLGLHPALGGLEALWRTERLAIVNGVGYNELVMKEAGEAADGVVFVMGAAKWGDEIPGMYTVREVAKMSDP
ncbi:MAG: hypothetical protein ACE5JG_07115, partial [Planctomycetota bacterium]